MPNDDAHKPPPAADDIAPKSAPLRWLWKFNHGLDIVKGLSLVTVLSSLVVGYFQYLNAYQEKVGSQAKEDMAAATATFTEISRAFSEVQALQQTLYSDFTRAVRDRSDESDQALLTKNARAISERYEKARIALRENIDVLTRKAEIYIDWASNTYRDPAEKHNVDADPLSRQVLRDYAFDCSDKYNFPAFGNVHVEDDDTPAKDVADDAYCAIAEKRGVDDKTQPKDAFIRICAGPHTHNRVAKRIYWYSAKHHVLTMHYCFEAAHNKLAAARQWASRSDRDAAKEREIVERENEINAQLDDLAGRVSAFSSLALHQMERIRVKYRPVGFLCSVPLVRNIPSLNCFPIRTASLTH
ncbi:hypothetical protein [Bradyrhizobium valentinum]|uniref:hypothetical protein n=1 Tax=Bradyrhizobium valentinum TaxID=1518501 RepID=UPI00070E5283|nr:hypothetical protein [Bradyrhizobium valentinum]KRR09427.1 hypothetical protein CQ10_13275 [Bradyrhizobium valentinum]